MVPFSIMTADYTISSEDDRLLRIKLSELYVPYTKEVFLYMCLAQHIYTALLERGGGERGRETKTGERKQIYSDNTACVRD